MNSMNKIIDNVKSVLDLENLEVLEKRQFAIDVELGKVHSSLGYLKSIGFTQLSLITCIDWIEEGKLQLVYILNNWEEGVFVLIRSKLDRKNAKYVTITDVFPGAKYYEREVHEFFGVDFHGNESSFKPLFLELWDDMPPLLKDFDPQKYSDKKFPKRELDKIYKSKLGGDIK